MTAAPVQRPSGLLIASALVASFAALLSLLDLIAGLAAENGYLFGQIYLHLVVVLTVSVSAWTLSTLMLLGRTPREGWLLATAAAGAGSQLPWTLAYLGEIPWFAIVGFVAALIYLVAAGLALVPLLGGSATSAAAHPAAAGGWGTGSATHAQAPAAPVQPAAATTVTQPAASRGAGAATPAGWYPDPAGGGWRWWDGAGWTAHQSGGR